MNELINFLIDALIYSEVVVEKHCYRLYKDNKLIFSYYPIEDELICWNNDFIATFIKELDLSDNQMRNLMQEILLKVFKMGKTTIHL